MKWENKGCELVISSEASDGWAGRTLAEGLIEDPQHGRLLLCGSVKAGKKVVMLKVRLSDKPGLCAAVEAWQESRRSSAEAADAAKRAEVEGLRSGQVAIVARWRDGEYLSDWEVSGAAAGLLAEAGAAKYVNGWGYTVNAEVVKALGSEFTLPAVVEFMRPQVERAEAARAAVAEARQAKFAEAARTGKPVLLRAWVETRRVKEGGEWGDYAFACSEWADPDGRVRSKAVNTY